MREPQRNQLRFESESLGLGVSNAGEVLEANKCDTSTIDDELTRVCGSDADHQHNIDVVVVLEQSAALLRSRASERNDVSSLEHGTKIRTISECGELHYVTKVRPIRVEDVVVPVRFEETSVGFEVAKVGSDAISAIEYSEEVR